jgi:CRISPR-associated protein Cmr5
MSKRSIENYIPVVMEVLQKSFPKGEIPSSYNGYISAFGASIMQSGLKPTLALFENENNQDRTKEDKSFLPKIILQVLDGSHADDSLLRYVLSKPQREEILRQQIIDIAIAVKLSIRTFKLV